ncbi:MAG TPA: M42 family metallopeptidase [Anaerolineaceae bacterium]|mgnify:FL=1|nr:M42 family metallopeptidase [Anaerolineaceae bacterium]
MTKPTLPKIDYAYLETFLVDLLNIPSPSGYTDAAISFVEEALKAFPEARAERTKKGSLLIHVPGETSHEAGPRRALTAHVDTLGAMVKEIKSNGRLELTELGGYAWGSVEGENLLVHTRHHGTVRGSVLPNKASVHVYKTVRDDKRSADSMEVRLDKRVANPDDVRALGIEVGDFVSFDPRVELHDGFVKSRHLDDKAAVAVVMAVIKAFHDSGTKPLEDFCVLISTYEEEGMGGRSDLPTSLEELIAIDMAAIGAGQTSDEFHASICVKDAAFPYHHGFSNKLRDLAEAYDIPHKVDIYVNYSSDATTYWSAGGSAAVALIGPGVDSSHHYERTHKDALMGTTKWVLAYLLNE